MSFVIRRKMDLSDVGEGWSGAYIVYTPTRFSDKDKLLEIGKLKQKITSGDIPTIQVANNMIVDIIKDCFVEGKGYDGKELVSITKENLKDLPDSLLTDLFRLVTGAPDPKKKDSSQI